VNVPGKSFALKAMGVAVVGLIAAGCASKSAPDDGKTNFSSYEFYRNATAKLTYDGQTFLLDPMLAAKGTLPSFAGKAPNPTINLTVDIKQIVADIDGVIVSHMHTDHFDEAAAQNLPKDIKIHTPRNSAPENPADPVKSNSSFQSQLEAMGFRNVTTIESEAGQPTRIDGITLTQVFGQHGAGLVGDLMGGVNGIVFEAEGQPTIYWTGDTILDDGGQIKAILTRYRPDVIIAHTGGAVVEAIAPDPLMMNEQQAIEFFEAAEAANPDVHIVAVHMDALDHCLTTRASLQLAIDHSEASSKLKVSLPLEGQTILFSH
jgi:L-ascorbate metabolism protein UlaG (beta-lactamase superfamily)